MAKLDIALTKVLGWEGGFANDPDDSGGATMKGVTIGTYTEYCKRKGKPKPTVADLKKITNAEILDLANMLYWSKIQGDKINNQSIANLCFDCVWGSGTGYIKVIQKVLGVTADGIFGNISLSTLNNWNPQKQIFNLLWNRRKTYLEGCSGAWKYLKGWMRRLNSFTFTEESSMQFSSFNDEDTSDIDESQLSQVEESNIEESQTINEEDEQEIPTDNQQILEEDNKTWLESLIEWIKKLFKIH